MARADLLGNEVAVEDLNNEAITIATIAGTTSAQTAAEQFPTAQIAEFPNDDGAAKALLEGTAKVLVNRPPFPRHWLQAMSVWRSSATSRCGRLSSHSPCRTVSRSS